MCRLSGLDRGLGRRSAYIGQYTIRNGLAEEVALSAAPRLRCQYGVAELPFAAGANPSSIEGLFTAAHAWVPMEKHEFRDKFPRHRCGKRQQMNDQDSAPKGLASMTRDQLKAESRS